jgi:hypothetical protein
MRLVSAGLALACAVATLCGLSTVARASDCAVTVVPSPDGSALSILFDSMQVRGDRLDQTCSATAPLNLPAGYSLGVYRVDYRGFAELSKGQTAQLTVDYELGPKGNGRHFSRRVKGSSADDFTFTENIGAGQMKRVGCGDDAALRVTVSLNLSGKSLNGAEADLDSSDGTSKHGLVYHFDLKKCSP